VLKENEITAAFLGQYAATPLSSPHIPGIDYTTKPGAYLDGE
jgi:hypothetical protein